MQFSFALRRGARLLKGTIRFVQRRQQSSAPSLFDSIDAQTFKSFRSEQRNYVRDDGRRVSIIPMQHVASRAFYDSILEDLQRPDRHYLVLIEGIMDSPDAIRQESDLATKLAQDPAHREQMQQWVLKDEHIRPGEEERLMTDLCVSYPPPPELSLVVQELYFKPRLLCSVPLKVQNADVLASKIREITCETERARFVLHGRTEHCARVLREHLDSPLQHYPDCPGADSIAVCWGQAHCRLLGEDLEARGFVRDTKFEEPEREYGWTEEMFNSTMANWRKTSLPII
eukprot:Hpha_TRINITY_DN23845_c0_g1::TRINITY_DN23845_c0_g1_i1::g.109931::m.109931